jgi:hypothetical protein
MSYTMDRDYVKLKSQTIGPYIWIPELKSNRQMFDI